MDQVRILRKAGRCSNGYGRDAGVLFHAVPTTSQKALCGTQPGSRSDWSSWPGTEVTCDKCLLRLQSKTFRTPE